MPSAPSSAADGRTDQAAVGDFDPDYLAWRSEQLAQYDRDYAAWREAQARRHDECYRQWRLEHGATFDPHAAPWAALSKDDSNHG